MNNQEKIIHIIQHIKNILHTRPKHMELVDFYHNVFEQYKEKVASLDDIITRPKILKEGLIETIEKVEERIYQSLDDYYAGSLLNEYGFQRLGVGFVSDGEWLVRPLDGRYEPR